MPARKKNQPASAAALGGVSAAAVRAFLLQSAELGSWTLLDLKKNLGVDMPTAKAVASALSAVGYIEPEGKDRWCNTDAGNTMAGVSRAKPITRKTAEKALAALEDRIREVNVEARFLYAVEKAVVFGPYLTGSSTLKNVDVAVSLRPKFTRATEMEARVKADAERAEADGKRFKSFADRRHWGENKVREHLKQRTRAIALADLDEAVLAQPHRVLFQE